MIEVRGSIDAPAAVAWRLLIDTEAWSRWGPSVRAVKSPARLIGPGSRGKLQTSLGVWVPFSVEGWRDGEYWRWRVAGIPATGHEVIPVGPGSCEVRFSIPGWAPFYRPVCALAIRRISALARARRGTGSGD